MILGALFFFFLAVVVSSAFFMIVRDPKITPPMSSFKRGILIGVYLLISLSLIYMGVYLLKVASEL